LHRSEIESEQLVVFFEDECHLLWGYLYGYIWGKTSERIEVPILNERQRQTYFGVFNLYTQQVLIQSYGKGNSQSTIAFCDNSIEQHPNSRVALLWDGAGYHRSGAFKDYLASTNQGLDESIWKITCIRFAPNDPKQNPMEDI
jgi:hypothetical protein